MANGASGRLDYLIQSDDRAIDRGFQADQRRQEREVQERMQKRQLRQSALFGGINAALGVGGLGLGVANYLQRGAQIAQQAGLQQQELNLRGRQMDQQQQNMEVSELLAGGAAAAGIASSVMETRRQKDQFDLSVTRGNERMLQNVSNDQEKIILDRINANDLEALDEGLRKQIVTYPPHIQSDLRSIGARIDQIQSDDSYSPQAKQRALQVLSAQQATLRWQVQPNPGKPMTASERGQADLGVIADPSDASKRYMIYYDRSGAMREFVPEQEKIRWSAEADKDKATHQAQLKAMYEDGGASTGRTAGGKSRTNTSDELDQIRKTLIDEKIARSGELESEVSPPTPQEVYDRALENRRMMIALDLETEQLRQNPELFRVFQPGSRTPFWPRPAIKQPGGMDRLPPTSPGAPQAPLPPQLPASYPVAGLQPESTAGANVQAPAVPLVSQSGTPSSDNQLPIPQVDKQRARAIVKAVPVNVTKNLPAPKSPEERDRLPRGTLYMAPDGAIRRKG